MHTNVHTIIIRACGGGLEGVVCLGKIISSGIISFSDIHIMERKKNWINQFDKARQ